MILFELRRYRTIDGKIPYSLWLEELDRLTVARVEAYVDRMKTGNFGRCRSVGQGVEELKINFGPGFRVYFVRDGRTIVVLLHGGDKGSQQKDIQRAHMYATDYWRRQ